MLSWWCKAETGHARDALKAVGEFFFLIDHVVLVA